MDPKLTEILQGELPYQSAIYVVFALCERKILVISLDIYTKYSIVDSLIEWEQSDERRAELHLSCHESTVNNGENDCAAFF